MKFLYTILLVLFTGNLLAQTNCSCCETTYKQFDFWVGNWSVTDTLGNTVGENNISKIEDNCIIIEHWKGATGSNGTSMNYYDKTDATWNQVWVDNNGNVLKLKGVFSSGKMILKSDLIKKLDQKSFYNQITWSKNDDGSVTQLWETYNEENKLLKTLFTGIYRKKK